MNIRADEYLFEWLIRLMQRTAGGFTEPEPNTLNKTRSGPPQLQLVIGLFVETQASWKLGWRGIQVQHARKIRSKREHFGVGFVSGVKNRGDPFNVSNRMNRHLADFN